MFTEALHTTARTRKRPKCPSTQEWIKMYYIYNRISLSLFVPIGTKLGGPRDMEKAMAPHSSTLAWKIPWTEEPGRLQSMGLLRVGHD